MYTIKNLLLVFLFILLLFNGCKIESNNQRQIDLNQELIALCKLWGFLKYYHPSISDQNINWDSTLLSNIDLVLKAKNKNKIKIIFDNLVINHIKSSDTNQICWGDSTLKNNFDLNWMTDTSNFSEATIRKIEYIYINSTLFKNKYIVPSPYVKNPNFESDTLYHSLIFPEKNIRLLALFRYWNMINYFYPYKYLMDLDWDKVLANQITAFLNIYDSLDYQLAICKLTSHLNDNHAYTSSELLEYFWGNRFLPVKTGFIQGKTIITEVYSDSLANINNLKIGDIIHQINGINTQEIRDSLAKYFSGSSENQIQHIISYYLSRSSKNQIAIKLSRESDIINTISSTYSRTYLAKIRSKNNSKVLIKDMDESIIYVDLSQVTYQNVDSLFLKLLNKKVLILDLRNNCNFIIHNLSRLLFKNQFKFYSYTTPCYKNPGLWCYRTGEFTGPSKTNSKYFKGILILLINHQTQSIGEFTTMALSRHPNAIIIGNTTAGADGNVSRILLPGGIETYISGIGIYWLNGNETQRIGIKPDIEEYQSIKGVINKQDNILLKALKYSKANI